MPFITRTRYEFIVIILINDSCNAFVVFHRWGTLHEDQAYLVSEVA